MTRHLFAAALSLSLALAIAVFGYLGLFLHALLFGGDLGGPLAFPAMVAVASGLGIAVTLVVLMPSVAAAELIAPRRAMELPLALGFSLLCCVGFSALGGSSWLPEGAAPFGATLLWLLLVVPVCGYWLCVRCFGAVTELLMAAVVRLRWHWALRRSAANSPARS